MANGRKESLTVMESCLIPIVTFTTKVILKAAYLLITEYSWIKTSSIVAKLSTAGHRETELISKEKQQSKVFLNRTILIKIASKKATITYLMAITKTENGAKGNFSGIVRPFHMRVTLDRDYWMDREL